MSKNILKSKTFWINVLGIVVAVASNQIPDINVPAHTGTIIIAVANIINRFFTEKPVTIN
jgi:uncharacterized membrane protein